MSESTSKRPQIVAIGGGTGMHALLKGLAARDVDVCAIITVADDGGSSGRLRKDFDIPPPGDIRNCLVALADARDPILGDLFQYRFEDSIIKGHSFGNLFIAVLTKLTGDFRGAIERARHLLGVRGKVIPATEMKVVLVAEHHDGSKSTGETAIGASRKPIRRIRLLPRPPVISEEIRGHLASADVICIGPGSLYTSICPNLLVPGMADAINASDAEVLCIANLMTQPGETDDFTLADHIGVLKTLDEPLEIDGVLCHSDPITSERIERYAEEGSRPIAVDDDLAETLGVRVESYDLLDVGVHIRHSPERLAEAVLRRVGTDGAEQAS